ncbi:MAG: rhomboid family intramembrane serine protease [Leucobacter sp.]
MSTPQFGERIEFGPDDVCYRHPDRPSLTLCQRCGHTICPECQTVSAVGVLCPDCVRLAQGSAGRRAVRSTRTTARRLGDAGTPVVTYGIMLVCAAVFVAQLLSSWFGDNGVTHALWYAPVYSLPDSVSSLRYSDVGFEPWRMLTSVFTHSTGFLLHILFNMFALWLFGRHLEQALGRAAFLTLYLFSGLGGSLAVMLWGYVDAASIGVPTVGASGAIFEVLAATIVAYRAARVNITSLVVLVAINFAIGLLPGAAISWQAHLGGMIVGALTTTLLLATRGPRKQNARLLGLIAIGAVLVALSGLYLVLLPQVPWLA